LVIKCRRALEQTGFHSLVVAGGVGANLHLREQLAKAADESGTKLFFPRREFCTDNAAMVAYAGWTRLAEGRAGNGQLQVRARWPLSELRPPATGIPDSRFPISDSR
ncbi:MAG: tRNA (adenosine(37)-N6)-threonylcarbamoyltransferase complex transferase subunit TsaD, partial [Hydrocarboniphaga effusa]|nr:tRNA (adenosine(37)-N6)-threonylcarbamoyltransferase complex transferase subunit TsaD [Hydrocarboniphaga effusa]